MKFKWTWPSAVVASVGLLCGAGVIALGHGSALIQVLAAVGTASGGVALVLRSVLHPDAPEADPKKETDE